MAFILASLQVLLVLEPPFTTQENPQPRIPVVHTTGRQVSKSNTTLGHRRARLRLPECECDLLFRKVLLSQSENPPSLVMPRLKT